MHSYAWIYFYIEIFAAVREFGDNDAIAIWTGTIHHRILQFEGFMKHMMVYGYEQYEDGKIWIAIKHF